CHVLLSRFRPHLAEISHRPSLGENFRQALLTFQLFLAVAMVPCNLCISFSGNYGRRPPSRRRSSFASRRVLSGAAVSWKDSCCSHALIRQKICPSGHAAFSFFSSSYSTR